MTTKKASLNKFAKFAFRRKIGRKGCRLKNASAENKFDKRIHIRLKKHVRKIQKTYINNISPGKKRRQKTSAKLFFDQGRGCETEETKGLTFLAEKPPADLFLSSLIKQVDSVLEFIELAFLELVSLLSTFPLNLDANI